jgi:hypothetical protein
LFAAAFALGSWYVPQVVAAGGKPHFYQEHFGAAVMLACGHGYVNPANAQVPELTQFLAVQRDDFQCDARLAEAQPAPIDPLQRAYRYLMTSVAWTWTLQGRVAWSALSPLYGLFFAATIVLLFAVFRQGMGTWLAVVLAVVIAVSPLHVAYLAQLRDYSKAPFVLALVLLAMRMILPPQPMRRAVRLAAVAGVVTGIGMGFRNDLLIAVPALLAALLLFVPQHEELRRWRRLAPPAAYMAAFLLTLSPMWSIYRVGGGNSSQHLVVLGLGEGFTEELGLDNGGLYNWLHDYRDEYAHALISGHATRRLAEKTFLRIYGPEYDRAAGDYLRQVALNFPADLVTRVYASTLRVLELPYQARLIPPHDQYLKLPRRIFVVRDRFQRAMAPVWLPIVGVALFILTLIRVRLGLFAIGTVFYLSAYPAIQFGERHYFHLEFISWWALGFVASLCARAAVSMMRERRWPPSLRPPQGWRRGLTHAGIITVLVAVVLAAPLAAVRRYQHRNLAELFNRYLAAPVEDSPLQPVALGDGRVRFASTFPSDPSWPGGTSDVVVSELFVAEFGGPSCDSLKFDAYFRYEAAEAQFDFTRHLPVQPPLSVSTPLRIYFPAYFHRPRVVGGEHRLNTGYRFVGLDVPESGAGCVMRLARISDVTTLPLLFELRLPPNWERADLLQTIRGWESRQDGDVVPTVYTAPADLPVGRQILMRPLELLDAGDIAKRSPTLDTRGRSWSNRGIGGVGGRGPFLYLFEMRPRTLKAGSLALVQGHIERGGISFGLVKDGRWLEQAGVVSRGEFTAVVRVPADGEYSLVLANNLPGSSLRNDLVIHRVGWVKTE